MRSLRTLSTPLRLRGRTGVFRSREGPPRQPLSGIPFFRLLPFGLSPSRGVSSCRGAPPADPRFLWIRSPFFWSYVLFLSSFMCVKYLLGGGRTCFPDRDCRCRPVSRSILLRFCFHVPRSLFLSGPPDVSSRPRLCTSLRPRFPPKSTVTAGTWTWTPSFVARLVVYGVVHGCRTFPG